MRLLAIDPGNSTGVAVFSGGMLQELFTTTPYGLVAYLTTSLQAIDLIAIEDSRCQPTIFSAKDERVHAKAMKIARDVGRIDALCAIVEEICKGRAKIIQISPKTKGAKLGAAEFKALTGWDGQSNQHERDAAMVGWLLRRVIPKHLNL